MTTSATTTSGNPLSKPIRLGTLHLRNANIMSSLTRSRSGGSPSEVTIPNAHNVEYYRQRAAGGAGLILSEGTLVSAQGSEWPWAPGIWNDEQVKGWKKVTDAVHKEGGLIICQLWHLGRVNHPEMPEQKKSGKPVIGPSAIAARGGKFRQLPGVPGYITPEELKDPRTIIEEYINAAHKAKEAGFDGVELHSANGYLPHEFLDSSSNHRTDQYGGSAENRARFGLEVVKELVDIWGEGRVGIKISPCGGYNDMGMPLEETLETYGYYVKKLDGMGLAYIQLVRYVDAFDVEFDGKKRATNHDVLASYSPHITHTPLILNGNLDPTSPETTTLLQSGQIAAAVFGRFWLAHPDLQKRVEGGHPLDNTPDFKTFYGSEGVPLEKGYTDYPTWEEKEKLAKAKAKA